MWNANFRLRGWTLRRITIFYSALLSLPNTPLPSCTQTLKLSSRSTFPQDKRSNSSLTSISHGCSPLKASPGLSTHPYTGDPVFHERRKHINPRSTGPVYLPNRWRSDLCRQTCTEISETRWYQQSRKGSDRSSAARLRFMSYAWEPS